MKKIFVLSLLSAFVFSSCLTANYGGKKAIFLVDAPLGLVVKSKGKEIDIKNYEAFSETTGPKEYRVKTRYKYPGFLLKVKRNNVIQLISGDKLVPTQVKGNPSLGIFIMFLEIPFTIAIGTIVDLATTSFFFPKSKYIDVKAHLQGTKPRTERELRKYVQAAKYVKMD